jgi:DNA-binding transcriptional ArsR family regulator
MSGVADRHGRNSGEQRTPEPTADILRKLANVVRFRAYSALHALGPMRAREVAELTGVMETSMSRHLEILRSIGFVDAEEIGRDRRSWIWSARPGGVRIERMEGDIEPAALEWLQAVIGAQGVTAARWVQVASTWPQEWRAAAETSDWNLHLTAGELDQLAEDIRSVLRRWKERSDENREQWATQTTNPGDPDWISPVVVITDAVPYPRELP